MLIETQFLTGEERFTLELPEQVDPAPDITTVVRLDDGARDLCFRPNGEDPDANPQLAHEYDVVKGGARVSVYRSLEESTTVVAYWRLQKGAALSTFMDDQARCGADVRAGLAMVIDNLSVRRIGDAGVAVDLGGPLRSGDPRDPLQRDRMVFTPRAGSRWPVVKLRREPPWAFEGTSWRELGESTVVSTMNSLLVNIEVAGPTKHRPELQEQAALIASSLAPAG
jgi:hypothetical protein